MRRTSVVAAAAALVLAVAVGGTAAARPDDDARGCGGGPMAMSGGHGRMMVSSEAEYLAEMIPHHEAAVVAAGELARSERPEMRELGEAIVTTQTAEIEQMLTWLERWYPDVEPAEGTPMMRDLTDLEGDALDRAFLEDMVMHHMMAVMMSRQLLARGLAEHDAVADFAAKVRDDQRAEIVTMRTWLAEWFDVRGPGMGRRGMHGSPGMHGDGPGMPGMRGGRLQP